MNSVRYSCVQGSRVASAVNYAATRLHQRAGYYGLIRRFIVPSRFTLGKMVEGGWDPAKFVHVPTFVELPAEGMDGKSDTPSIAYVGRLDHLKGVDVLLRAAQQLEADPQVPPFSVKIAGGGDPSYVADLKNTASKVNLRSVSFLGPQDDDGVRTVLQDAWCSVVPSLWYENMPNAALESMAAGTAVVASDHGSLPELVQEGKTGWLTTPGDPDALAAGIRQAIRSRKEAESVGAQARMFVEREHSAQGYYERLMETFSNLQLAVGPGGTS